MATAQFDRITQLLEELQGGNIKQAAAGTEAGEANSTSSHPTAKVDDGTQTPSTGARAAEYSADTKDLIPANTTVDATADNKSQDGDQDRVQPNIGTHQSAIGEDSAVENNYKDKTDEPGMHTGETSTPLKYGVEKYASMSITELEKEVAALGNQLLAPYQNTQKTAEAAQAGYVAATLAGQTTQADMEKAAAFVDSTIQEALLMADLVGAELQKAAALHRKQAGLDEAGEGEDHSAPGDAASGANPSGSTSGGAGVGDAGAGAAGAPGGGMPPEAGGDPLSGMLAGQQDPGAQPSEDELLQALMELLQSKGITPEMLQQMAQGAEAGGGDPSMGGGMPPEAGGPPGMGGPPPGGGMPPGGDPAAVGGGMPPPEMLAKAAEWRKIAFAVGTFKKSGRANNPRRDTRKIAGLKPRMAQTLQEILRII